MAQGKSFALAFLYRGYGLSQNVNNGIPDDRVARSSMTVSLINSWCKLWVASLGGGVWHKYVVVPTTDKGLWVARTKMSLDVWLRVDTTVAPPSGGLTASGILCCDKAPPGGWQVSTLAVAVPHWGVSILGSAAAAPPSCELLTLINPFSTSAKILSSASIFDRSICQLSFTLFWRSLNSSSSNSCCFSKNVSSAVNFWVRHGKQRSAYFSYFPWQIHQVSICLILLYVKQSSQSNRICPQGIDIWIPHFQHTSNSFLSVSLRSILWYSMCHCLNRFMVGINSCSLSFTSFKS